MHLILNSSSVNLLVSASDDYITKATQAIKDSITGSPADHTIRTIKYLNINNAILNTTNA
jgi:hypothetical protein